MWARLGTTLVLALSLNGLGCPVSDSFRCRVGDNCTDEGLQGYCEASGYCSFDDPECGSGRRYAAYAASELANTCVEDPTTGTSESGPSTTGDTSSDSAATTSAALEICDNVDNDGDGLIDEYAPGNEQCNGCELLEVGGRPVWACPMDRGAWAATESFCARFGARPARLDTPALVAAATELAGALAGEPIPDPPVGYWTSGRLAAGVWEWADGTATGIGPDDWAPNQPGGNDGEDCLIAAGDGWRDGFCATDQLPFMCDAP